mmetsp:Transcript_18798/g.21379  ORF Transcript_18798/g.21379 Transcript_18798/m.21379 type:complete len:746 (+) Transcript_18798:320-2557(+)
MGTCTSKDLDDLGVISSFDKEEKRRQKFSSSRPKSKKECKITNDKTWDDSSEEDIAFHELGLKLYELIYNRKWFEAMTLIEKMRKNSDGDKSLFLDSNNRSAIHWSCVRCAPLTLVKNLIEVNPEATGIRDQWDKTPLHLALEYNNDQFVLLLVSKSKPNIFSIRDKQRSHTPLAEALFHRRSPMIISHLIDANKSQIERLDHNENTPTAMFFRMNMGSLLSLKNGGDNGYSHDQIMEVASLLLATENHFFNSSHCRGNTILHSAIMSPSCPFAFVQYILENDSKQVEVTNDEGNLPIHVAAAFTKDDQLLKEYKCSCCGQFDIQKDSYYFRRNPRASYRQILCGKCINDVIDHNEYVKLKVANKANDTIAALLDIDSSNAEIKNNNGDLPLFTAVKSGQSWRNGILPLLVKGFPDALSLDDHETGLKPFMIAAADFNEINHADSSIMKSNIYEMLLCWPNEDRVGEFDMKVDPILPNMLDNNHTVFDESRKDETQLILREDTYKSQDISNQELSRMMLNKDDTPCAISPHKVNDNVEVSMLEFLKNDDGYDDIAKINDDLNTIPVLQTDEEYESDTLLLSDCDQDCETVMIANTSISRRTEYSNINSGDIELCKEREVSLQMLFGEREKILIENRNEDNNNRISYNKKSRGSELSKEHGESFNGSEERKNLSSSHMKSISFPDLSAERTDLKKDASPSVTSISASSMRSEGDCDKSKVNSSEIDFYMLMMKNNISMIISFFLLP